MTATPTRPALPRSTDLTLEEKARLLAGADFWHTMPVARLGIPALRMSDGPSGVRGERAVGTTSVSFPCGVAIGATFDEEAAAALGAALADECLDRGVHVLLGPTVNLQRHPLGGRHFEAFSEDPVLTGRLATAYVRALQSAGVAATVKHFVANDTEYQRHTISSDVTERVLRELYLSPFEAAVCDGGAWAVMSAYNRVNGVHAAEHTGLLAATLRSDWGFGGAVISDWFGTKSTVGSAEAGLDVEMPGPPIHYGDRLRDAVLAGEIDEGVLEEHVERLLALAVRTGALATEAETPARRPSADVPARRALARRLAAESFVLLRNGGDLLPLLLAPGQTLAVIGPNAARTVVQGGGSARVNPAGTRSVFECLRDRLEPKGVSVVHERGCVTWSATPPLEGEVRLDYYAGTGFGDGEHDERIRHTDHASVASFTWMDAPWPAESGPAAEAWIVRARTRLVPSESGSFTFSLSQVGTARLLLDGAVVVDATGEVGRGKSFFGMGSEEVFGTAELEAGRDYELVAEYVHPVGLPLGGMVIGAIPPLATDSELLRRAEMLASKADVVVCVVGTSAEWETEGRDRLSMDLPGPQDHLVRRLALANPRTCVLVNAGSPVTMDWSDEVAALAQIWFGGEQAGEAAADVLLGDVDPGGRLPVTIPRRLDDTPAYPFYPGTDGHAVYGEGLLVGYRHYDTRGVEPRFCFGDGLSYTSFELSDLEAAVLRPVRPGVLPPGLEGDAVAFVDVTLANTGRRAGSTVVQCYVHDPRRAEDEPEQQLRGFRKAALEPGETTRLRFALRDRDFARFDESAGGFVVAPGAFEVRLGRSSRSIQLRTRLELS